MNLPVCRHRINADAGRQHSFNSFGIAGTLADFSRTGHLTWVHDEGTARRAFPSAEM